MLATLRSWAHALKAHLLLLWFSRTHPDTPLAAKMLAMLVVAYAFSPIDLILVPLGIYLALRLLPANVIGDSRKQAEAWLAEHKYKPRNYPAAACVILAWALMAYWTWVWLAE